MQPWRAVILARDPAPVVHREHATPRLLLKLLLNKIYRNLAISIKYTRLWYVCINAGLSEVQTEFYARIPKESMHSYECSLALVTTIV